jgi:tetratricopeptide (TPR) repeat protein
MFRKALQQRPSSLECWRLLAEVRGLMGDVTEMQEAIESAVDIYTDILTNTSASERSSNEQTAAIFHQLATSYLSVSLLLMRAEPYHIDIDLPCVTICKANIGEPAIPLLEKALQINPRYGPALVDRVVAIGMTKNRPLAVEKLLELKKLYPKHPALPQLLKYLRQLHP